MCRMFAQDAAMTPGKKEKKDKKAGKKGKDGEASPEAGDAPQESGERKTKGSKSAVCDGGGGGRGPTVTSWCWT